MKKAAAASLAVECAARPKLLNFWGMPASRSAESPKWLWKSGAIALDAASLDTGEWENLTKHAVPFRT